MTTDLKYFKAQAQAELNRLEAEASAKDVAGKAIGKHGLKYITAIVIVGVGASLMLEADSGVDFRSCCSMRLCDEL